MSGTECRYPYSEQVDKGCIANMFLEIPFEDQESFYCKDNGCSFDQRKYPFYKAYASEELNINSIYERLHFAEQPKYSYTIKDLSYFESSTAYLNEITMEAPQQSIEHYLKIINTIGDTFSVDKSPNEISLNQSFAALNEILELDEDWDGYGALPIEEPCYNAAKVFMRTVCELPEPDIFPNSNGTISIEWETNTGYSHLEIGTTLFSLYLNKEGDESVCLDGDLTELKRVVLPRIIDLYNA